MDWGAVAALVGATEGRGGSRSLTRRRGGRLRRRQQLEGTRKALERSRGTGEAAAELVRVDQTCEATVGAPELLNWHAVGAGRSSERSSERSD